MARGDHKSQYFFLLELLEKLGAGPYFLESEGQSLGSLLIQNSNGQAIRSVKDWFDLAPPKKGKKQWKDGRSAKELAKAWFRTGDPKVPEELEALFKSHPLTEELMIERAIPERKTKLDDFRGETRNSDLILIGNAEGVRTLVGIEAKADEPFGQIIREYLEEKTGTKSKVPDRIDLLARSIFGQPIDEKLGQLHYQLLHSLAGTLIEAKQQKASLALFVVHEFISKKTNPEKVQQNKTDFERFVLAFRALEGVQIWSGIVLGPIKVNGGEFVPGDIPALIGKVTTKL
jgi:hypothetical protein